MGGPVRRSFFVTFILAGLLTLTLVSGCGSTPTPVSVTVSAASTQTDQGQTVNVTATVMNAGSNTGVTWGLNGPGSLGITGADAVTYDAPASVASAQMVTVTATSNADSTKSASVQITVNLPPQISTTSLASGTTGTAYNQSLAETGGSGPFAWAISSGAIPTGLSLNAGTGAITGTPSQGGTWNFTIQLTDADSLAVIANLALSINSTAAAGNPVPFVNQPLVPSSAAPGGAAFTLTVNGTGFLGTSTVMFNGTPLTPSAITANQLTVTVPATSIATAGTASITVVNPNPGGGASNPVYFPITASATTITFANAANSPINVPNAPVSVAATDLNADGKTDLAVLGDSSLTILLGAGNGTFTAATNSPISLLSQATDPVAAGLVFGDFNNDGNPDLAVVDSGYSTNNVPVFLGSGTGTFTASVAPGTTNSPSGCSIAPADFNGDGSLDLAAGNGVFGGVSILLGFADGAFNLVPPPPVLVPSAAACSIAVGDFNGDGKLDLAVPDSTDNVVAILLGNGDGTFTQATGSPITISGGPDAVLVADFNGDGKLDLAVANGNNGTVTILLGNGDGTFTQAAGSPITVGNTPDALAIGDFLGNGKLDIAVANFGDGTVTLLLGNGDGTFTQATGSPFPVGNGPTAIAVADFNGDGKLDLAVTNSTDGTVSILLQQ